MLSNMNIKHNINNNNNNINNYNNNYNNKMFLILLSAYLQQTSKYNLIKRKDTLHNFTLWCFRRKTYKFKWKHGR